MTLDNFKPSRFATSSATSGLEVPENIFMLGITISYIESFKSNYKNKLNSYCKLLASKITTSIISY